MERTHIILTVCAFALAMALSFMLTPVAKSFAFRVGAIDVPKDNRRMHKKPIPRLGGIAIFTAFFVSVICLTVDFIDNQVRGVLLGALIIVVLGVVDDVLALKPLIKGIPQIFAVFLPVFFGVRIEKLPNFLSGDAYVSLPLILQYVITMIWIMAILNAVNLIDGLDGLACGVSTIMSLCLAAIAYLLHDYVVCILATALAGACIGFLPYNLNPAKLFMGDTGAMFIGYTLGCLMVLGPFQVSDIITFAVPFLILGLPIFDMAFAAVRRILSGRSPFSGDKKHLHHKLVAVGLSQRKAVAVLYSISAILGIIAVMLTGEGFKRAFFVIALIFVIVAVGLLIMLRHSNKQEVEIQNEQEQIEK